MHNGEITATATGEILLGKGEFIVMVTGRSNPSGSTAGHLKFTSNRGNSSNSIAIELLLILRSDKKWGPFGATTTGEAFTWNFTDKKMGLLYFTGSLYVPPMTDPGPLEVRIVLTLASPAHPISATFKLPSQNTLPQISRQQR